eukprot:scaffold46650_cov23-Tisochrysis_lutea.AAC.1
MFASPQGNVVLPRCMLRVLHWASTAASAVGPAAISDCRGHQAWTISTVLVVCTWQTTWVMQATAALVPGSACFELHKPVGTSLNDDRMDQFPCKQKVNLVYTLAF